MPPTKKLRRPTPIEADAIVRAIEPDDPVTQQEALDQLDAEDVRAIRFQMQMDGE